VLVVVLGGGATCRREERFVLSVPGRLRPSRCGQLAGIDLSGDVGGWVGAAGGTVLDHEDPTWNAPDGTAATIRPQASGCAWARLAARHSPTPPASTAVAATAASR
jgi:hypothetical protein